MGKESTTALLCPTPRQLYSINYRVTEGEDGQEGHSLPPAPDRRRQFPRPWVLYPLHWGLVDSALRKPWVMGAAQHSDPSKATKLVSAHARLHTGTDCGLQQRPACFLQHPDTMTGNDHMDHQLQWGSDQTHATKDNSVVGSYPAGNSGVKGLSPGNSPSVTRSGHQGLSGVVLRNSLGPAVLQSQARAVWTDVHMCLPN